VRNYLDISATSLNGACKRIGERLVTSGMTEEDAQVLQGAPPWFHVAPDK
jgi:hypothetical protein